MLVTLYRIVGDKIIRFGVSVRCIVANAEHEEMIKEAWSKRAAHLGLHVTFTK